MRPDSKEPGARPAPEGQPSGRSAGLPGPGGLPVSPGEEVARAQGLASARLAGPDAARPGAAAVAPASSSAAPAATAAPAAPISPPAPWSAWHREFLRFLAEAPAWWIGPLLGIGLMLILLRWLGPDVDAQFVYSLF